MTGCQKVDGNEMAFHLVGVQGLAAVLSVLGYGVGVVGYVGRHRHCS